MCEEGIPCEELNGKALKGRLWQIYIGYNISEEKRQQYINHWKGIPTNPSLIQKAGTLIKAGTNWLSHGAPVCSKEQKEEREAICKKCEYWQENNTCAICGCLLKFKQAMKTESCPEKSDQYPNGRWQALI